MAQTDASRTEIESDQTETLREISTEFNPSNSTSISPSRHIIYYIYIILCYITYSYITYSIFDITYKDRWG